MGITALIILLVFTAFYSIQVLSFLWVLSMEVGPLNKQDDLPQVSLLLAARNEEQLILRSLEHIHALNYPKDKIQILIGDDDSSDGTAAIVRAFIADKPEFALLSITETLGKARGKANVLAHLAHQATGSFYFITDVDVALPPDWIHGMLEQFADNVGVASGTTVCERGKLFANMQSVDWLHFMGYIKAFAKVGVGCTSVGNNMAVRAEAYWQTGGYEDIDFSITEDYKLFKEVTANGWAWSNHLHPATLGKAWYIPEVKEMLHQRKRWLIGARELPLNWKAMIVLYGMYIPCLVALAFISPQLAAVSWFLKFSFQSLFITTLSTKLNQAPFKFHDLILYEVYVLLTTVSSALFYILPLPSVWKGRVYTKTYIRN